MGCPQRSSISSTSGRESRIWSRVPLQGVYISTRNISGETLLIIGSDHHESYTDDSKSRPSKKGHRGWPVDSKGVRITDQASKGRAWPYSSQKRVTGGSRADLYLDPGRTSERASDACPGYMCTVSAIKRGQSTPRKRLRTYDWFPKSRERKKCNPLSWIWDLLR